MNLLDIAIAKKMGGGGGSEPVIESLSVTENGTYEAPSGVDGYSPVTVNVSGGGGDHDAEDGIIARTISGAYENSTATKVGFYAFYSCTSLTAVSFPNVTSIGANAFNRCSSLTTANFPNATTIGDYAFFLCSSLTAVSFPNVTSIGGSAFSNCSSLATVSFPNVTSISGGAFYGCSRLTAAYFLASSVATLGVGAFTNTPMSNSTYTGSFGSIYVPASLVYSYRNASNWSSYYYRITAYTE